MKDFERYKAIIDKAIEGIALPDAPQRLYAPISYTTGLGGKRLRPILTLAGCELFGGNAVDALDAALGIEIFHNFTLLHDDIMDEAPLRRGKPTVYKNWNANVAILSGDTMFAIAYSYIHRNNHPNLKPMLDVFTRTAIEVCEGQQYDMDFETQDEVSISEYLNMIRMKTAVLLGASLKIGALTAEAEENQADMLYDFGINVGMAFQLKDDFLDAFGDAEKFGKSIGGDITANKKTFLYLKCLELANSNDRELMKDLFRNDSSASPEQKIQQVLQLYDRYDIRTEATSAMESYFNTAIKTLEQIKADANKKQSLSAFAAWLYKRDY
jgi:geranylgeranyl diphosphate synthase, type II